MKNLRKPYLSVIMASLFLFLSCSQKNEVTSKSIESTVEKHLELTKELYDIYINQSRSISFEGMLEFYNNKGEFKNKLKENKFESVDKIVLLTEEIQNNIFDYIRSNSFKSKADESYIINIITNEIKKQSKELLFLKAENCDSAYAVASQNCLENYAIATAGILVTTWWTLGVGTIVAFTVATGIMVKCENDASAAYAACLE